MSRLQEKAVVGHVASARGDHSKGLSRAQERPKLGLWKEAEFRLVLAAG